jgi:hypothetical protein
VLLDVRRSCSADGAFERPPLDSRDKLRFDRRDGRRHDDSPCVPRRSPSVGLPSIDHEMSVVDAELRRGEPGVAAEAVRS